MTLVHPAVVTPLPLDGPLAHPVILPQTPPAVNELAPLASQHHTSEYNRLKFGPQGCPFTYIPMSIQVPDYFSQLQQRQQQYTREKSWWPCNKPPPSPVILGSRGAQPHDSHLQEQIEAAISEPLDNLPKLPNSQTNGPVKTSSTHPINISFLIPPELIPLISSHLLFVSASPVIFEIAPSFTLDRLLVPSPTLHHLKNTEFLPAPSPSNQPQVIVKNLRTRTKVTEALQAAINGSFPASILATSNSKPSLLPLAPRPQSADILSADGLATMTHSNASSISLSLPLTISEPPSSSDVGKMLVLKNSVPSLNEFEVVHRPPVEISVVPESSLLIGNLFLSSCPGKKVRLEGPAKGRSAVCRDLNLDLRRMKELGVGCIICCLDDGELEFLGAPWPEYECLANANGIDVLRIPIPEGLAPLSPAYLDAGLTKVINTYSLNGVPVLVHCRGGVGRAGVIACCWLIRLGLCGWIDSQVPAHDNSPKFYGEARDDDASPRFRKDTIQFVRKVIAIARRRRSLKAVETYEQVRFLVDYVEYLRLGHYSNLDEA